MKVERDRLLYPVAAVVMVVAVVAGTTTAGRLSLSPSIAPSVSDFAAAKASDFVRPGTPSD
jgi:hypothetical protein